VIDGARRKIMLEARGAGAGSAMTAKLSACPPPKLDTR
jgi:hypothetical protein